MKIKIVVEEVYSVPCLWVTLSSKLLKLAHNASSFPALKWCEQTKKCNELWNNECTLNVALQCNALKVFHVLLCGSHLNVS